MATIARQVFGEPGTLYARCGGVFGISAFVDRCMDLWMACDELNANVKVARWHAYQDSWFATVTTCAVTTTSTRREACSRGTAFLQSARTGKKR